MVKTLCALLDAKSPRPDGASYTAQITYVADRPGHDRRYAIDCSKLQSELGWAPRESFETGLAKTVDWYLKNRSWTDDITQNRYNRERLGAAADPFSRQSRHYIKGERRRRGIPNQNYENASYQYLLVGPEKSPRWGEQKHAGNKKATAILCGGLFFRLIYSAAMGVLSLETFPFNWPAGDTLGLLPSARLLPRHQACRRDAGEALPNRN